MDSSQETFILCLIREHFSKATDGDGRLIWDNVKGYRVEDAERAISEHRVEKGSQAWRPDIKRVRQLAATYHRERQRADYGAQLAVSLIRATDAEKFHGMADVPAILMYFGEALEQVTPDPENGIGYCAARSYVLSHCRKALGEVGVNAADAETMARDIVGLQPGEKIVRRPLFKTSEPPDTSSWTAMKALAVAEFGPASGGSSAR